MNIDPASIRTILEYFGKEGLSVSGTVQLAISRLKALQNFKTLLQVAVNGVTPKEKLSHDLFSDFNQILTALGNKSVDHPNLLKARSF